MIFVGVKYIGCAIPQIFLFVTDIWFRKASAVKRQGPVRGGLYHRWLRIIAGRGKNRTPRRGTILGRNSSSFNGDKYSVCRESMSSRQLFAYLQFFAAARNERALRPPAATLCR